MAHVKIPSKLKPLFEAMRYKVMYGGRGGAKSHSVAQALLLKGTTKPLRILCAREVQKSIKQSVHKLLSDYIVKLGLTNFYEILETEIRGINGTEFSFAGLAGASVDSVKSFEGVDICWVEEGQVVTDRSWTTLINTIRAAGSEIWITFNPFKESDSTYQRFVINPPPNSWVCLINYYDNPWFYETELEQERAHCEEADPDNYPNIWLGEPLGASDMQFITSQSVDSAMGRTVKYLDDDALICGIDLARGGKDDCVIYFRRGLDGRSEKTYTISGQKSRNSMTVVSLVAKVLQDHQPDQVNVDEGSMGGPIVDRLNQLGWNVTGVNFGGNAMDDKHYGNRTAEMWDRMRKWIINGGSLPKSVRLKAELTNREFYHDNKDRLMLESKQAMRKGPNPKPSPDYADAVALTFAIDVAPIDRSRRNSVVGNRLNNKYDVDPMESVNFDEY